MQFNRARRLSFDLTMCQGAKSVSVAANIESRAIEYSYHSRTDSRSVGLSFHCRRGSSMRARNRCSCSPRPTSSQYLMSVIPSVTRLYSNRSQLRRNFSYSLFSQNPRTRSTPARLYQLRSKMTISPAAGMCAMYRWTYI